MSRDQNDARVSACGLVSVAPSMRNSPPVGAKRTEGELCAG